MKTTETGAVSKGESNSRLGFYLGIGLAGAAGLGLGMAGKTAWQRLSTNPATAANLTTGGTDRAQKAAGSEPTPVDKSILQEAFVEAFGPPAGLPAGLAQAATDLPAQEIPSFTLAQSQLPAQESVPAANPGNLPKIQESLIPLATAPMMIRHIGPDGLERIGIDFENSQQTQSPTFQIIRMFGHGEQEKIWAIAQNMDKSDLDKLNQWAGYPAIRALIQDACSDGSTTALLEMDEQICQVLGSILIQRRGPDGLARIGVDTDRLGLDFTLMIPANGKAQKSSNKNSQVAQTGAAPVFFDGLIQQAGFMVAPRGKSSPAGDGQQSGGGAGGMAKVGPSSPMGMEKGTLGSQEPEPLIGSFTTDFEDGYLKLPEELAGWVVEGKVFIAPGPDGGLRMAPLEDLETMFSNENDPQANRADNSDIGVKESAPSIQSLRRNMRRFYGLMTACTPEEDEEGGLWIPLGDQLAKQAGLKGEVVIVGMRTHAEIWSKEGWEAELATPKAPAPPKQLELQKVESRTKAATPGK